MSNRIYIFLLVLHAILAYIIHQVKFISKIYAITILIVGIILIIKNKDRNHEVLKVSAYLVGAEVFLRMTSGAPNHEFVKYSIILLSVIGMIYNGISKAAFKFFIVLLLLLPSLYISFDNLLYNIEFRKTILFNLSGPLSLIFCSIYYYHKKIHIDKLIESLKIMVLPIVSMCVYLFLYTPNIQDVIKNTTSNFATSGGFGPNQVSTVLGIGMFVFFTQLFLKSKNYLLIVINALLLFICTYRGIITFSRGGVYVGIVMIIFLIIISYLLSNSKSKIKISYLSILFVFFGIGVWTYSSVKTGGMIDKRYANVDSQGREKESKMSGRETLMETEIQMFLDNPMFGIGVGNVKSYREEHFEVEAASHNEVTRLFAEHGLLGAAVLVLLITFPLLHYYNNKEHIFLLSFYFFWALTINHAAMRIAAPSLFYALTLLTVHFNEKNTLHR